MLGKVYYVLYADGYAMQSNVAFDSEEPSLGRIRVHSIAPPHSPTSIKQCISRAESNPAIQVAYAADLFVDTSCETPLIEDHISLCTDGPGLSPDEPMAIVLTTPILGPDGRYYIKNRAEDIFWSAENNIISTVYFYPTSISKIKSVESYYYRGLHVSIQLFNCSEDNSLSYIVGYQT